MNLDAERPDRAFLLLANGSCDRWSVDLTESPDGTDWSLELDGPQCYLVFDLRDTAVVGETVRYLMGGSASPNGVTLGRFGSAEVSLVRDDEEGGRYFLLVGARGNSTMRLTLNADDVRMFTDALEQVLEELPPAPRVSD